MAKNKEPKVQDPNKVSLGNLLAWNSRMVSTSIFVLLTANFTIYGMNVLHLDGLILGAFMVVSRIIDAITDTVAGFLVDKFKFKGGKGRPYEIFIVGLWICTWLMFSCPPEWATAVKYVWIFLLYIIANSVCYTLLNAGNLPYMIRAYKEEQMVKVTSYGSIITMLAAVIFNIFFPQVLGYMGYSAPRWRGVIAILSLAMAAIGIIRFFVIKEKYDVDVAATKKSEDLTVKDIVVMFKNNPYLVRLCIMGLVFSFVANMGVSTYYFYYVVGNVALAGVIALVQIVAIPLAFVFPQLLKKMNVVKLMMWGFFVSAFGYLLNWIAGSNMILLAIAAVFWGAGTIPASMLLQLALVELADFNEWKGMPRMEASMAALNGLMSKIGGAVGAGILSVLLSLTGYTGELAEAGMLPASAITTIRLMYTLVPLALYAVTAIVLWRYNLHKKLPEIRADLEKRRGEALAAPSSSEPFVSE